MNIITTN